MAAPPMLKRRDGLGQRWQAGLATANQTHAARRKAWMRERDKIRRRARPGETAIPYCCDCALCECPPIPRVWTRNSIPLDVIFVGRDVSAGTDRCLHCGATWTLRVYRWQPARLLRRGRRRR